jgi:predicted GIY-YIG superfamily endonuclease|tara:strand:- start:354 stop:818 length:465 start_codon:yes stop_codon:yes gene_type:complete
LEDKCKTVLDHNRLALEALLTAVKEFMIELKKEILADDDRFEDDIKEAKVQEMVKSKHNNQLVMFHKQRVKMEAIEEQYRLKRLRHTQYDELLFMVFRYWSAKVVELLFDSKQQFNTIFSNLKNMTQFEVSICFSPEGTLDSEPTMEEHRATFK